MENITGRPSVKKALSNSNMCVALFNSDCTIIGGIYTGHRLCTNKTCKDRLDWREVRCFDSLICSIVGILPNEIYHFFKTRWDTADSGIKCILANKNLHLSKKVNRTKHTAHSLLSRSIYNNLELLYLVK